MKPETPRTDAFFFRTDIGWDDEVEFARQLERELNASQEAYLKSVERDDYLTQELAECQAQSHGLARRVVEAETKLEVAERDLTASNAALDQMTEDAVNLNAEVERLKDSLKAWTTID
jgi:transposase